jgi:hypothetical protein
MYLSVRHVATHSASMFRTKSTCPGIPYRSATIFFAFATDPRADSPGARSLRSWRRSSVSICVRNGDDSCNDIFVDYPNVGSSWLVTMSAYSTGGSGSFLPGRISLSERPGPETR